MTTMDKNWYQRWYPDFPIIIDDINAIMEAQEADDFEEKYTLKFNIAPDKEPYLVDEEILQRAMQERLHGF